MSEKKKKVSREENVEVYVTKYALTEGVYKARGTIGVHGYFHTSGKAGGVSFSMTLNQSDYHRTETMALWRVKSMIRRKLKSIDKDRAKVMKLKAQIDRGEMPMRKEGK